jgi:uncharacterized RDD family membrane protein YckC
MFCKSCGKQIDDDSAFCSFCGAKQPEIQKPVIKPPENLPIEPQIVEAKTKNKGNISTPAQETDLFSDIKIKSDDNRLTFQKTIGSFFCILGFLVLASYFSFLLLDNYPIRIPNIYMYRFYGVIFITPALGIHLWAVCGIILLLGSFFFKKKDPVAFKKILAFVIDGIILLFIIFLVQGAINGEESFKIGDYIGGKSPQNLDLFLEYKVYKTRLIVCSLFFAIYYFYGQLTGGTFGSKLLKLKIVSFDEKKITFSQAFLKTLYYGIGTWVILLFLLSKGYFYIFYIGHPPFVAAERDVTIMQIGLWTNFVFILSSSTAILINKQNRSVAEIISRTKTIITQTDDSKLKDIRPIFESQTPVNTDNNSRIEIPAYEEASLFELHKLIDKEKRKLVSGENSKITDSLKSLISNKEDFLRLNEAYKLHFKKTIMEHLISISSAYSTTYYYVTPLVELGICESIFPHKVII